MLGPEEGGGQLGVRKYLVLLQDSLAIKFAPVSNPSHPYPFAYNVNTNGPKGPGTLDERRVDFLQARTAEVDHSLHAHYLFKGFREANLQCYWNGALSETFRNLQYKGYVVPSTILVSALPRFLNTLRSAWARQILRTPPGYRIHFIGEIEELMAEPIGQGQFAPLSDSLCWAILELTSIGEEAFVDQILGTLKACFPSMTLPPRELVFQTLEKLTRERKVYQTAHGYFVVTPDTFRYMTLTSTSTSTSLGQEQRLLSSAEGDDNYNHERHNYHSGKRSPEGNLWDEDMIKIQSEDQDLGPRLKRHNSLKAFRQRDIVLSGRSSSLRLSKSKSCGRVDDDDAIEAEIEMTRGSKNRRSTLSQITSLVRSLRVNSNSSSTPNGSLGSSAIESDQYTRGKSLFRKLFGRTSRRTKNPSLPTGIKSVTKSESVQTQTSKSTEQLATSRSSVPLPENSATSAPVEDNVYDEPRPLTLLPPNFPSFGREESSRCSTLSSQAASSLGYASQGYPSLNLSTGSNSNLNQCNCQGHSPCPYYDMVQVHSPPSMSHTSPVEVNTQNHHNHCETDHKGPNSEQQTSFEFYRRKYPNYSSSYSRNSPHYSSLIHSRNTNITRNRSSLKNFNTNHSPLSNSTENSNSHQQPKVISQNGNMNKVYEPLLTTMPPRPPVASPTNSNSPNTNTPSKIISEPGSSTSTVTQNMKSTTNMELELLLPLGNIMKAALNAKKQSLKEEFFRKEFNEEMTKGEKNGISKIPINLDNSNIQLRVGDPQTETEVKTTINNNGIVSTQLQSLPVPLNNLKSEMEITLNERGEPNIQVTKISSKNSNKENRRAQTRKLVTINTNPIVKETLRI